MEPFVEAIGLVFVSCCASARCTADRRGTRVRHASSGAEGYSDAPVEDLLTCQVDEVLRLVYWSVDFGGDAMERRVPRRRKAISSRSAFKLSAASRAASPVSVERRTTRAL